MTAAPLHPPVVITGLGFITSIGNDKAAVRQSLLDLNHGFEACRLLDNPDLPIRVAGTIKGFDVGSTHWADWRYPAGYPIDTQQLRSLPPHGLYALCALHQAIADAGLVPADLNDEDTGLFCASAGSPYLLHHHLKELHARGGMRGNPMGVVCSINGTLNFNLATFFKIQGANCGFVSACSSSTHAIGYACDEIRLGRQKRIFVVGAEDLTAETHLPFHSMRTLSKNPDPDTASRPFDQARDGFVPTGGAVVLVLEDAGTAMARGARVYGQVAGWGQSADGHNLAVSHPEGRGLVRAMAKALAAAGITPSRVDYVNAHATSTLIGDRSEAIAIKAVFDPDGAKPAVSSTKALTGHGLSMAGAMETAFCALAIADGFVPGAAHLVDPDPQCQGLDLPRSTLARAPAVVLKNSSGFGGSNVCLVLQRWEA